MNVLQNTDSIIRDLQSEKFFEIRVPDLRQIAHRDFALNQPQLNFKTQQDVQIVGHFVGFNANKGGGFSLYGAHDLVDPESFEISEMFQRDRIPSFPKRTTAPNMILPEAGLRLQHFLPKLRAPPWGATFWTAN